MAEAAGAGFQGNVALTGASAGPSVPNAVIGAGDGSGAAFASAPIIPGQGGGALLFGSDIIPGVAGGAGTFFLLSMLTAGSGPLLTSEEFAADVPAPVFSTGPLLEEALALLAPPPPTSTGPLVEDTYDVFAPTPPTPPIPSPPAPARPALRARGRASATKPILLVLGRYTGLAYPFGVEAGNALGPKDDLAVIFTSIVNILTTPKGTVPYDPKMGSQVPYLVFEPNDEVTRNLIRYFSNKDLSEQEPRIVVYAVFTEQPDDHTVVVTVGFQIVGDPTAKQYNAPATFTRED